MITSEIINKPYLLKVPSIVHDLTIKASHTGITILKEGKYKKRYTGSRTSEVDINGNLYLKKSEFVKATRHEPEKKGNKKRAATSEVHQPSEPSINEEGNITESFPQSKKKREYRVNKVEVRNRLHGMINTVKGKKELYFWTITFPAGIADDLAYQAFNTWLTSLRQKKYLRNYLWIAERQTGERLEDKTRQATNTIHFHIAIPHKMSVKMANGFMRTTLTTFSRRGLINFSVHQCRRYNGVDIAKNRKTGRVTNFAIKKGSRSLSNYLTKYVTKNNSGFTHLAWHNSRGFSALFTGLTFTVPEFLQMGFDKLLRRKSAINNEWFLFFPWLEDPPWKVIDHLFQLNSFVEQEIEMGRITK